MPRLRTVATAALACAALLLVPTWASATTTSPASAGASVARANPSHNLAPTPNFDDVCAVAGATSARCHVAVLAAINHARAMESVRPMVLPTGFWSLPGADQIFVASDLERVARGLRPFAGLVSRLNQDAAVGARADQDPPGPGASVGANRMQSWGSIWAGDYNALAADYDWMYNDGWGGSYPFNTGCTSPGASACWVHRDIILAPYAGSPRLLAGAADLARAFESQFASMSEILVGAGGPRARLVYSWSSAVRAGAGR